MLPWLAVRYRSNRINQNDIKRAQQIQATVARLKEKAEHCSGILRKKREREEQNASDTLSGNDTTVDNIIPGIILKAIYTYIKINFLCLLNLRTF